MELDIYLKEDGDLPSEFFASLVTCRMLVVLNLKLNIALNIPMGSICFPYLKALKLELIKFEEDTSTQNLISSCPVLEDLKIERCVYGDNFPLPQFIVASQTLKRLTLHFNKYEWGFAADGIVRTMIDTPALRFLEIWDECSSEFVVGEMGYVSEAKLDLRGTINNDFTDESLFAKCLFKLLRAIYNTEYLLLLDVTMVVSHILLLKLKIAEYDKTSF